MKRKILVSGLLVCLLALSLVFVSCDNGTTGDGHPEIENAFYIGRATTTQDIGRYFYIGNSNISDSQDTKSIPDMLWHLGNAWDNTPTWKSSMEWILSTYQPKKNGKSVTYTDLPDYSGTGAQGNRNQHFVFSVSGE